MTIQFAYLCDETDSLGPHVLLCEACIKADGTQAEAYYWHEDEDARCACCGATDTALGPLDCYLQDDDYPALDNEADLLDPTV